MRFLLTSSFFPPYHIGGDALHVKYLAEELVKRGHEVHILHSLDAYYIKRKDNPERSDMEGIYTYRIKTALNSSAYEAYMLGNSSIVSRTFTELIHRIRPDVVHHHNISLLGYSLLKKRGNYVNLYTAHDYWLICQRNNLLKYDSKVCEGGGCLLCNLFHGKPPQLWRYSKRFEELIENEIDYLIAPSNYLKTKILEKYKVKTVTIPNFVPEPPTDIKPLASNYFVYAGVLEKHKGIIELLKTYKEIVNETDDNLLIAGSGSLKTKVAEFINKHKLSNKVHLLGYIKYIKYDALLSLLKGAKALIIPSIWPENCPLIALEAISVGTPVIASNKGGLPEIVRNIDNELIFNSYEELKQIIKNFDRKKIQRDKIREVYREFYSPQAFYEKYIRICSTY
ncbi:MAG: glycosyltransferase [Ignisphaera sp.]